MPGWGRSTALTLSEFIDRTIAPVLSHLDQKKVGVYAVGGYGRSELCPFSDVDLLFVTKRDVDLSECIADLWNLQIKPSILIRSVDHLERSAAEDLAFATTLIDARFLFGMRVERLDGPKHWIKKARPKFMTEHHAERDLRRMKHKGAGCQEPNLREGRGGLRDLQIPRWLSALGLDDGSQFMPRNYDFILGARIAIHCALEKREDRLLLSDQPAINDWLGWTNKSAFAKETLLSMKNVVRGSDRPVAKRVALQEFLKHLSAEDMRAYDRAGAIGEMIPEWKHVECLTRNDPVHIFTPEEHTLRALESLDRFMANPDQDAPVDVSNIKRPDLLSLAVLFHDLGKGSGMDHSIKGKAIVEERMKNWNYPAADIELVSFLVEHHLLLSHNAFMRDVHDPGLIYSVAKKVGNIKRLTMLYVLTIADIRAVSDDAFSDWKATLLNTFTKRLEQQCQAYLPPDEMADEILRRRRESVNRLLPGREDEIEEHFQQIDARYALVYTPEQIAHHIELLPRLESDIAVIEKTHHSDLGFSQLVVITRTHHGLFAEIAGTLSARGFNILEADISTRQDGIAIDSFRVSGDFPEGRWDLVDQDLKGLFLKNISADELLAARIPYAKKSAARADDKRPFVSIDNVSSITHTIVEVMAPDEMGLLYRIVSIFRDCGMGITSAIVSTSRGLGVDVFYITSAAGLKIVDRVEIERIEQLLKNVIEHRGVE